jgi:hypothetical protein
VLTDRLKIIVVVTVFLTVATAGNALAANKIATCAGDKLSPLALAVDANRVEVSAGTPMGKILLLGFGRAWDAERYAIEFRQFRALLPADASGLFAVERTDAQNLTWVALDLTSGRCGVAVAEAGELRQKEIQPGALKIKDGKLKKLEMALPFVQLVLVRPQDGAWSMAAGDASLADEDGKHDGRVSLSLGQLTPIGGSGPAPSEFEKDDVVFVLSPEELSVAFARVVK